MIGYITTKLPAVKDGDSTYAVSLYNIPKCSFRDVASNPDYAFCRHCPFAERHVEAKNRHGLAETTMSTALSEGSKNIEFVRYVALGHTRDEARRDAIGMVTRCVSKCHGLVVETCGLQFTSHGLDLRSTDELDLVVIGPLNDNEYFSVLRHSVESLHARHKLNGLDKIVTYLHPDMTLEDLAQMRVDYGLQDKDYWELRPYVDTSDPLNPVMYEYENMQQIMEAAGNATFGMNYMQDNCVKTIKIKLKGGTQCATTTTTTTNNAAAETATTRQATSGDSDSTVTTKN